jgi:tyrosyl-tRNA synthetase
MVTRFHSRPAAEQALTDFEARFKQGVLPEEMPEVSVNATEGSIAVAQLLKQAGLVESTSEALRMITQAGVKLDGERVSDKALTIKAGVTVVAQVGKRKFARITIQ